MVLKRLGLALEGIAILIITIKLALFLVRGDFSTQTTTRFITEILTFSVEQSIPLEVTLIQVFGVSGIILIIIDSIIDRGN